jgi:hypothetical protein
MIVVADAKANHSNHNTVLVLSPTGRRIIAHGESRGSVDEYDEPREGRKKPGLCTLRPCGAESLSRLYPCAVGYDLPLLPELAHVKSIGG